VVGDKLERRGKRIQTRELNENYSRRLKLVFKSAAIEALKEGFYEYDERKLSKLAA